MALLEETWREIADGTSAPPSNPHQMKLVLVRVRNLSMHPDVGLRRQALSVAGRIATSEALQATVDYASDTEIEVRRALLALAADHGRDGLPILRRLSGDPDAMLAVDAVRRLTNLEDRASTSRVRGLLTARHPAVRNRAAVFLGRFGGPALVPLLRRAAEDPDPGVREAVGWALRRIEGGHDDPPPSLGLAGISAPAPAGTIISSAPTIAEPPGPPDGAPAQPNPTPSVAPAAAAAPRSAPGDGPGPTEVAATPRDDGAPAPRGAPSAHDAPQGPTPAPPPGAADGPEPAPPPDDPAPPPNDPAPQPDEAAPQPDEAAPPTAEDLLRAIGSPDADRAGIAASLAADETGLSAALRARKPGVDPDLNLGAAIVATVLGNPRWLAPVRKLATDPDPQVRAAVATALGAMCTPAVYRQLEQLVQDPHPAVQLAATPALSEGARRAGFVDQARKLFRALPESAEPALADARAQALAALDPK
jgi:HEAT repeat protein